MKGTGLKRKEVEKRREENRSEKKSRFRSEVRVLTVLDSVQQIAANILLFICSNVLGAIDYYIADRKQRRSVLETRQSLEVKLSLETQNVQQVRKSCNHKHT